VPFIDSLSPLSTSPGGAQFTLTVNGAGFISGISIVEWNGTALATTFVSAGQLTATVPASLIASAETAAVTVLDGVEQSRRPKSNPHVPSPTSLRAFHPT
jgi:hypothetical protein